MRTLPAPFLTRHAVNPMLSDEPAIDEQADSRAVFMTPIARKLDRHLPLISAITAGVCLAISYLSDRTGGPVALTHLTVLIAFALAGVPGLKSAWESLLERRVDIDVLMLLGAALAAVIGQPQEGALLLFLFALSGALEEEATRRAKGAIGALRDLRPPEAIVLGADGSQRTVSTRHVPIGASVLIRPGDRVPLDGSVVEGESTVDEAPITGESMPRLKRAGDPVYAGTINGTGRVVIEVTQVAADTHLAKIIRMVTQARTQRARVERLFDRIGPGYAIGVIAAAVLFGTLAPLVSTLGWRESTYRAIALLIVASPCALIIATPTAYLSAMGAAARKGVLVKGGVYLEGLAGCRTILFDKTGTLTEGKPRLAELIVTDGLSEADALQAAGALEASSSHPLASAIQAALTERGLGANNGAQVELVAGQGVRGTIGGEPAALGTMQLAAPLLEARARDAAARLVENAHRDSRTVSVLALRGHAAVLTFEDPIREEARDIVRQLRDEGVQRIVMLTGDHARVAKQVAETLGLDAFHADLLPEQKIEQGEAIRQVNGPVAMVGDGVNDAPVLAHADVGIAMASVGSDAALEAAPIVLMGQTLARLGWLVRHARRTARIVRQNLVLAMSVIVVLSGFAVAGQVQLPVAVVAHEGSTLLVALNALRLLRA